LSFQTFTILKKQTFIAVVLIIICSLTKIQSKACSCAFNTFEEECESSDLIFKGVVSSKKDSLAIGKVFYTFKSTKIWKGQYAENITIETNFGGPACGARFDMDKEYLIFSFNSRTSHCRRRNVEVSISSEIAKLDYKFDLLYRASIAIDSFASLTKLESDYFNIITKGGVKIHGDKSNGLNFIDKKIAFFDNGLISKSEYFKRFGGNDIPIHFEKFSENEIKESNGFYGILCVNKKKLIAKRKKKKLLHKLIG
jgi:hypothetical protein